MKKLLIVIITFIRVLRLYIMRLMYGNNLVVGSTRQKISLNTEITLIGKEALIRIGKISTKKNVSIVAVNGCIEIGSDVSINRNSIIVCHKSISIGDGCSIGPNVCIYDHDHKFSTIGKTEGFNCSDVIIEENCWIAAGVVILRGTHIGKNSVIGAGTVVKGHIPEGSLVTSDRSLIIKSLHKE